jgi:hypothetical protein
VDIFSPASGQLLDSWVFRTALDSELTLLQGPRHGPAPATGHVLGVAAAQQAGASEQLAEEIGRLADRIDELSAVVGAALSDARRKTPDVVSELLRKVQAEGKGLAERVPPLGQAGQGPGVAGQRQGGEQEQQGEAEGSSDEGSEAVSDSVDSDDWASEV